MSKKEKKKDNKYTEIKYFIIMLFFIITLLAILILCERKSDTYKILNEFIKSNLINSENTRIEGEGKDRIFKYSYIDATSLYSINNGKSDKRELTVAKYNSSYEALAKLNYIESYYKLLHEKFNGSIINELDDYNNLYSGENYTTFVIENYLFSVSDKYKDNVNVIKNKAKKIVENFKVKKNKNISKTTLKKYWEKQQQNDINEIENQRKIYLKKMKKTILEYEDKIENCQNEKCDELFDEVSKYGKYEDIKEEFNKVKEKYNEVVQKKKDIVDSINSDISNIENNLNQEEYNNIKNRISELKDSYYDQFKGDWNNRLNIIEEKVFKNSCGRYLYEDVLRNSADIVGKSAYWSGVVTQRISSNEYRIGINCTKYQYIDGYSCKDTIYMIYEGDVRLIENDIIDIYGTLMGNVEYKTVIGAIKMVPGINAKYVLVK